ncbi:hypothetical protein GWK47_036955 [Chionoecetes opilio]|uniref:Uncharacterized protein n=1 Tax=Chionoecetes opilio TaxID=41210 RepID=A0A8J5CZH8_CHIOP|nr:hypothetical protein GWK47_036955 [Chionoecetes opilio]
MIRKDNIVTKIEKPIGIRAPQERRYRRSEAQISKEKVLSTSRQPLRRGPHGNALTMMTNQEDKEFLLAQREPGRRGRMGGVDSALAAQETRQSLRLEKGPAAFPGPANKKRLPLPHLWRSSSPRRRPAPTL